VQKILVARESHKGIVVGDGGHMLGKIGTAARLAMQDILGEKVRLHTRVVVDSGWQERVDVLRAMGLEG
jgi:GTP-binding protein Era